MDPESNRLRNALAEAVAECVLHNEEYHHVTANSKIKSWRAALADATGHIVPTKETDHLKALTDAVGRLEAFQRGGWLAHDELVKTLTSEMNGVLLPGTSVERFGLVPAIKAALSQHKEIRRDLVRERDVARSDCEALRRMVFRDDRVLFEGRGARTRSCSACHVGAVPDPYWLAPLDGFVVGAPVTSVMAIVVGSAEIFETTREAREIADRADRPVAFDFRNIKVIVSPGEDPDAVARTWWFASHGCTPEQSAERR
jgi:hypothetical protein